MDYLNGALSIFLTLLSGALMGMGFVVGYLFETISVGFFAGRKKVYGSIFK